MVYGIFTWLLLSTDKWAIEYFIGSYELGLYIIIYQIGYYPMTFIGNIISQFYTPIYYQKETNLSLKKFMFLILFISLIFSYLSWQFNTEITTMLLSNNYLKFSVYLPILVLAGGIYSTGQYLSIHFQKKMMLGLLMKIKIFTSLIGIIIYCSLIFFYGVRGLIFGSLIFSTIFFITMNAFSLKIERNEKYFKS